MSKLSEPLKQFINAAHARPNTVPAPKNVASIYERIAFDAASKKVGLPVWLSASVCSCSYNTEKQNTDIPLRPQQQ